MQSEFVDPLADFDASNPLRADASVLRAETRRGKPCYLIDNTGDALPQAELREILQGLIEAELFGFRTLSASGGEAIHLDRRESAHVQVGGKLYRLIVYRYEARVEPF